MSIRTIASAVMALAALLLVAFAPSGAAAHAGHTHSHNHVHAETAAKAGGAVAATDRDSVRSAALAAEVRAYAPASIDSQADSHCGDRGCCANGHCAACGMVIAPVAWACFRLPAGAVRVNPDATQPAGLAREGPPRPPKTFV